MTIPAVSTLSTPSAYGTFLARLDVAESPEDLNLPGFSLHELKGNRAGTWAVTVRANWRVTFCFEGQDVADVNYEDYH